MDNTENETIETNNKIQVGARVDPAVYNAIERLARGEERTLSNTIERLLKQSPRVQEILEGQSAEVAA